MIKKLRDGRYALYSHNYKQLGTFGTRQAAGRRERQIVFFKHQDENDDWWQKYVKR